MTKKEIADNRKEKVKTRVIIREKEEDKRECKIRKEEDKLDNIKKEV